MVVGHPAVKNRVGNRGGVLILVDKVIDARPYKGVPTTTKMWAAIVVSTSQTRGSSANAMIGTVYLPPGEDALNMSTLHDMSTVCRSLQCPFLWVGDFNRPPEELQVQCLRPGNDLHVITPGNTPTTFMSGGRSTLIDYGVASTKMHHMVDSCMGEFCLPFASHIGVKYALRLNARSIKTTRLMQPRRAIIEKDYDRQLTWAESREFAEYKCASIPKRPTQEQVDHSKGMGFEQDAEALSDMYSKWSMAAEAQLLSRTAEGETPRAEEEILRCMGRGQTPQFMTKPICPKKGRQEFRTNQVLNQLHGVRALLQQKRALEHPTRSREPDPRQIAANHKAIAAMQLSFGDWPVSYTHLTLPTKRIV